MKNKMQVIDSCAFCFVFFWKTQLAKIHQLGRNYFLFSPLTGWGAKKSWGMAWIPGLRSWMLLMVLWRSCKTNRPLACGNRARKRSRSCPLFPPTSTTNGPSFWALPSIAERISFSTGNHSIQYLRVRPFVPKKVSKCSSFSGFWCRYPKYDRSVS